MSEPPSNLRNRVHCSGCGESEMRKHGLLPIGWEEMPEANGRRMALCTDCVRRNLWLIEARFDIDPGSGI